MSHFEKCIFLTLKCVYLLVAVTYSNNVHRLEEMLHFVLPVFL